MRQMANSPLSPFEANDCWEGRGLMMSWVRKMKRWQKHIFRHLGCVALGGVLLVGAGPASANPSGPQVQHGQVQILPGQHMQINQYTDRAIIDWQSFSVGVGESVRFLQPSDLAVILNRVVGQDPSSIMGQLQANGTVFLINPNGILFGPNSTVNVGSLVATTLDMTNEDFLAGQYRFQQRADSEYASVVNQGQITINDGGFAILTGPMVANEGMIVAKAGHVRLQAGDSATLDFDGRDLVHFQVSGDLGDGPVILAPGMMSDALSQALGITQENRASRLVQLPDGRIRLQNGAGTALNLGTTDPAATVSGPISVFNQIGDGLTTGPPENDQQPINEPLQEPLQPGDLEVIVEVEPTEGLLVTVSVRGEDAFIKDPAIFAQNDTYMIEDDLAWLKKKLRPETDDDSLDPWLDWWDDRRFLQKKFREE